MLKLQLFEGFYKVLHIKSLYFLEYAHFDKKLQGTE